MATCGRSYQGAPSPTLSRAQKHFLATDYVKIDGEVLYIKPHLLIPDTYKRGSSGAILAIRHGVSKLPKPVKALLDRATMTVKLHSDTRRGEPNIRVFPAEVKVKQNWRSAVLGSREFTFRVARHSAAVLKYFEKIHSFKGPGGRFRSPKKEVKRWSSWDEDRFFDEVVFAELRTLTAEAPDLTTRDGFLCYVRRVTRWFRQNPSLLTGEDKRQCLDSSFRRLEYSREFEWQLRQYELKDELKKLLGEIRDAKSQDQKQTLKRQADAIADRLRKGVPSPTGSPLPPRLVGRLSREAGHHTQFPA